MTHPQLSDAILEILSKAGYFQEEGGERFEAITQTDLMERLREKGWKLPAAGWFLSEVESAGFQVRQGYQFSNKVRRAFSNGETGRALSKYQTIVFL